jgi:hypothetical protein
MIVVTHHRKYLQKTLLKKEAPIRYRHFCQEIVERKGQGP